MNFLLRGLASGMLSDSWMSCAFRRRTADFLRDWQKEKQEQRLNQEPGQEQVLRFAQGDKI
jgi:hypothetical protein